MLISIVITTLNRAAPLQACLEALSVDFPTDAQVIVVSDGGDPQLFPDLSRYEDRLNLKIIHAAHGGPASARNHGLEQTTGPVVLFLDDDCLPAAGWVEIMAAAVTQDPPRAVGGKTINGLPGNPYATTAQLILDLVERDRRNRQYPEFFFPSNNIAFPALALKRLGGFDTSFRTCEDRELCRRWRQAGYDLIKAPEALLKHAPDLNFSRFWSKCSSYGEGAAKFRQDPREDWALTIAYHFRIPSLLRQEFRDKPIPGRLGIMLLIMVWELANLVGYCKGHFKRGRGGDQQ